jgi:cellobiose-specific phosphotransferase system component IIC
MPVKGEAQMQKTTVAFFLGLFSVFLFFFIGEKLSYHYGNAGLLVTFVVMLAYFFICQFFLSRGNPNAYRKDWPIMLLLDGIPLLLLIPMVLLERREVILSQGLGILVSCCGGTWAGAFAASMKARRKREQI